MVPALCARQAPVPQMSACARGSAFATPSETCCLARNAGSRRHDHPPPAMTTKAARMSSTALTGTCRLGY
jgi:hypothetical protein